MPARNVVAIAFCAVALSLAATGSAWAVQELDAGPDHRGIVTFEPFRIFPENRAGNAVYFRNRLIFSLPGQTILHILALPKEGRFAYLVQDAQGKNRVGLYLQPQDKEMRLTPVGDTFAHAVMALDGIIFKKLYRVSEELTLSDQLPSSKTADGAAAGERGVAFYHVATVSERAGPGGAPQKEFGMRLHVSLYDDARVLHLSFPVQNALPELTLRWQDPEHLVYTLADGREEVLSLSQFQ
ncbi:MAG: hypothetical protein O7D96_02845 [SAR324 cluster bacterium]|nr:hypothetical protein [SAR324 cluster bacterium]